MQKAVPIKPLQDPHRLWRYPGEGIASVILMIVAFLLLWDVIPMRTNQHTVDFVYGAKVIFYDIAPWIAGIGAACCIVYLLLTEQAKWGPILALAVQLGFLFYGFSNLVLSGLRANLVKSYASKLDASLVGALDRREGTYDAPDAGFRVADDSIRKVRIFDQLDKEKNQFRVIFVNEYSPRWSIEVLPVKESGAPEGVTPDGFAEFIGKKMEGKPMLLNEKRTTAAGPAQRLFLKMRGENRSMEILMTDHLMIRDKWYRVSASDLAGADAGGGSERTRWEPRFALEGSLDRSGRAVGCGKSHPNPPSSRCRKTSPNRPMERIFSKCPIRRPCRNPNHELSLFHRI